MSKEKVLKHEKGSVAVFAIVAVFSLIFILSGVFAVSTTMRKSQLRTLLKIKEVYLKDVEVDPVARVGEIEYLTLQSAIDSVEANNTETSVYLLKDINENVTIPQNKNILLNMGGHTLEDDGTGNATITQNGTLKVNDGVIKAKNVNAINNYGTIEISEIAKISNYGEKEGTVSIYNQAGAKATITGGEITSTNAIAMYNLGTATITGGTFTTLNSSSYAIYNEGTITSAITGATINGATYGV